MQLSAIDDSKKVVMFFTLPSQYFAVFSIILTKLSYLHHDIAAHNVTFNSFSSFDTCLRFVCVQSSMCKEKTVTKLQQQTIVSNKRQHQMLTIINFVHKNIYQTWGIYLYKFQLAHYGALRILPFCLKLLIDETFG